MCALKPSLSIALSNTRATVSLHVSLFGSFQTRINYNGLNSPMIKDYLPNCSPLSFLSHPLALYQSRCLKHVPSCLMTERFPRNTLSSVILSFQKHLPTSEEEFEKNFKLKYLQKRTKNKKYLPKYPWIYECDDGFHKNCSICDFEKWLLILIQL